VSKAFFNIIARTPDSNYWTLFTVVVVVCSILLFLVRVNRYFLQILNKYANFGSRFFLCHHEKIEKKSFLKFELKFFVFEI
jgi:hypothetical protein